MSVSTMVLKRINIILSLTVFFSYSALCQVNKFGINGDVSIGKLKEQVGSFVKTELVATLDAIKQPDAMPSVLFGEPTDGGTNYISLANSLLAYQKLTGEKTIGRHQIDEWVRFYLLKEVDANRIAFPQLFVAHILLQDCGNGNLGNSALWKSFTSAKRDSIIQFLDLKRLYNVEKDDLGGRPNNYYGVALLLATYNYKLGIEKDKETINLLFNKSFDVLKKSNGFLDDGRKFTASFDRYNHEFVRFLWESAVLLNDQNVQQELKPIVKQSAELWWDLFSADLGHSSAWGRSLQNSWDDTFEQTAFFSEYPDLSPTTKPLLGAAFLKAYNYYIDHEYNFKTHLNRMLDFGKGTYYYAGRNRIFGYTQGTLHKLTVSADKITTAFDEAKIDTINTTLNLPDVNRFEVFRSGKRTYGVWTYRYNNRSFTLPVVGNGIISSYSPAIYGIPGLEAPVAQQVSNLVPIFGLGNNLTLSTAQGADSVKLDADKNALSLYWKQLSNAKGELNSIPLNVKTAWKITGSKILYTLQFNADEDTELENFKFWIPSSYPDYNPSLQTFFNEKDSLKLTYKSNFHLTQILQSTQDSELGKGAFHAIPLILKLETDNLFLKKKKRYQLEIEFSYTEH